ncbi:MAG: hypothetical protein JRJ47_08445 [Deltaproteobacteria bacterium]|nr:hypothetical protein [Deltaproteobacteria bacterium]
MSDSPTILDKEAEELFKQLGGIEKREALSIIGEIAQAYEDEQAKSDPYRINLIELVQEVCAGFLHHKFFKERRTIQEHINRIVDTVGKLSEMPDHDGQILIRYRGLHSSEIKPIELDYVISFGNLIVTLESALTLARRHQDTHAHLHAHLIEALSVFRANNMTTLFIRVPQSSEEAPGPLEPSLEILYQYYQAVKESGTIVMTRDGEDVEVPPICDLEDQPDPNLTMVAGLNDLNPASMKTLLQEVDEIIKTESEDIPLCDITNVFNAIFSIGKFKEKYTKPPIEIDNVKWLMMASDQEILQQQKMKLINTVFEKFGGASQEAVQVINTLYEGDFNSFSPYDVGVSLQKITGVLEEIEARDKGEDVENELLDNMEERLDPVSDELLDDITIKGDMIEASRPGEEPFTARVHDKIIDLVKFFKGRSQTRKKLIAIMTESVSFDDHDYDIIGRMFEIPVEEAPRLVENIEALFDEKGNFLRSSFESRIPEFAKYGANIFFFLWVYLKEMKQQSDRIAFLNALQFLIAKLEHPDEGIKTLLEDFISNPTEALPSDRNAMVLANILLRKENWEIGTEIEITPEEVLLVEDNINEEAIEAATEAVGQRQDDFIRKVETIHTETKQWLWGISEDEALSIKYLVSLEREIYIFLSILNPPIAMHVLRNAVQAYGDPRGQVYGLKKSRDNLNALVTLLRVVVRALERVGTPEDIEALRGIKDKQQEFLRRKDDSQFLDIMTRLSHHCDKAIQAIERRSQ